MAHSQCIDDLDSPRTWPSSRQGNNNNDFNIQLQELYNERHRLALEELVSGGVDRFMDFLKKEEMPNFLSDDELRRIGRAAVVPRCVSFHGGGEGDMGFEQSMSSSMDCSSVTYFPEVSDVEPPLLEIGWPAFTSGSYRGVTRAVAHFQPSYGECIYSCKEAARRMIKSAKEVIAIVTDSLTDLDIFKDLQEACTERKVPVYILLDQSCAPAFLKMCRSINVSLDELRQMRVRTITGPTYFMRSGAKITGKVHERFMLIDGNRVATGSYRFNWTDGKLNSSNLIELSGQITENFDEEFRILYAQSMPIGTRGLASARNSGIYDHLLIKHHHNATSSPMPARDRPVELCLTSTPSRALPGDPLCLTSTPSRPLAVPSASDETGESRRRSSQVSNSSTVGEDWMQHIQEVLAGSTAQCPLPTGDPPSAKAAVDEPVTPTPTVFSCHISTQTSCPTLDSGVQTDPENFPQHTDRRHPSTRKMSHPVTTSTNTQTNDIRSEATSSSNSSCTSPRNCLSPPPRNCLSPHGLDRRHHPTRNYTTAPHDNDLRDCFRKLTKERQYHYSTIRTKLEHMVTMLSHRRELGDITNMTMAMGMSLNRRKAQKERAHEPNPGVQMDSVNMGTWPRARCVQ